MLLNPGKMSGLQILSFLSYYGKTNRESKIICLSGLKNFKFSRELDFEDSVD